ncbi:MAG TPA: DUF58 domain-containing protein, partial [Anaerolineales bacterium]
MNSMRLRTRTLPWVTLALIAVQILSPSKIWEALLVVFGGIWLIGFLWSRSILKGLHLERSMRFGWAQVGDALEEQFVLSHRGRFPVTWVEVLDHSDLPGYAASLAACMAPGETSTWRRRGLCARRGVYTLGGATLHSGDPLGIYSVEIEFPQRASLVVMPPVVPLPALDVAPGGWLGEGRTRPEAAEKVYSASSVRPYQPGDSLRLIHWRTTARLNEPHVRQLEGAPEGAWWIVLDMDRSVQAGDGEDSTVEAGVILAASLADRGLKARKEVGLLAAGEEMLWMRPRGGEARRLEVLRGLAVLRPGGVSLADLLEKAAPSLGQQASLIVISPSMRSEWLEPLGRLAWRGIAPTVILMDPASFGGVQDSSAMAALLSGMGI